MYRIYKKIVSEGIEMLPFVEETLIGENDIIFQLKPGTQAYIAYILYQAIQKGKTIINKILHLCMEIQSMPDTPDM